MDTGYLSVNLVGQRSIHDNIVKIFFWSNIAVEKKGRRTWNQCSGSGFVGMFFDITYIVYF
jgi:hypothetical protein